MSERGATAENRSNTVEGDGIVISGEQEVVRGLDKRFETDSDHVSFITL